MNLVVVDTPGRGGTLRFKKIYGRPDYEVPVAAILDYLATRDDVDSDAIGLAGVSLGGYWCPRIGRASVLTARCARALASGCGRAVPLCAVPSAGDVLVLKGPGATTVGAR